jgi:hypothetical protein
MALILTDNQKVLLSVTPESAAHNAAAVENPKWISSDESVLTLAVVDGNELAVVALTTGKLGNAQVTFTADARIGEGEVFLTAVQDITVIAGEAVSLTVNAGVPESK